MKRNLFLTSMLIPAVLSAGNLLRNSSFELGGAWVGSGRCIEITGSKIPDPGPEFEIDSSTSTQGKKSLKLDLKKSEETICWRFSTHEFDLKPGKDYTFSFDAKCAVPGGQISFACVSNQYYWQWHSWQRFKFTDKWQRYSMKVRIPPLKKGQTKYNEKFWMVLKTVKDCVVWFDAMNLEEGRSAVWKPIAPCETVVSLPDDILVDKDSMTAKVSAVSYDADRDYTADVKIDFSFPPKKIAERKVDFKLKKGEVQTKDIVFGKLPYGAFTISSVPGIVEHSFVRVHDNQALFGPGFQVGLISGSLELTSDRAMPDGIHHYWQSVLGKPGEMGRKIRLAGATWNNSFNNGMTRISALQPEKGKFEWFRTDIQIANARKHRLKPTFAIATQSLLVNRSGKDQGKMVAKWLRDSDRFGKPEGQTLGNWSNFKIVLPPPQVIADHVKAILQRYPNEYEFFMIFAEFNGYMTPDMIIEYAKAVEPVVRKYSPKTKFIAYNPTGDFNGRVAMSYKKLLQLGAGQYTHAYAFHPYDCPMDTSPHPAHHAIREMKKSFREAGADKELWNTEIYYLYPIRTDNYRYEPSAVTRRLALDMGEGVRASSPLPRNPIFTNNLTPLCDFNHVRKEPNAKFAAYNAAGYFLNGAFPVSTLENNSTLGYTFKNRGRYYTVLWSRGSKTYVTLEGSPKVYDFYGNELKAKLDRYLVGREPVFLEWGKSDPSKTVARGIYAGLNDFVPSDLKRVPGGIGMRLRNDSGMKLGGSVRLVSPWLEGPATTRFAPFDNETTVAVPVTVKPDAPAVFPVRINLSGRERVFSVQRTFNNVPVLQLNRKYELKTGSFLIRHKDGILTVEVDVPECSRKKGKKAWEGDCVEIYLDTEPLAGNIDNMKLYHPGVTQSIVSLAEDGNNVEVTEIRGRRGLKAKVMPGVKVVASVPVKAKYLGFNISIQNDGKYSAFRGKQNFRDRSQFSLLEL